ncbi:ParA family protein [Sulfurimonas hydrogeniphila]|uniref:ParA family protein n=1 Tax=Sulfurimonas hydrogeniphila TaxID=2509341 RepID=UPI00125F8ECF|nr:ParA family protein [Sulfurimonas hydrogeniphila]
MIVLFSHQKGGVGKSTIAINFAYQVQKKYKDITILDLDSQHSAVLFNQLRAGEKLPTIKCVTQNDIDLTKFLSSYMSDKNNLLIIDSGGYDSDINRTALIKADIIITPVGISQIEIFGLQKFRKILKDASEALGKKIKTNVLLNNVDSRSKSKLKDLQNYIIEKHNYFNLLESTLYSRADYKNSYGEGLTVKELNKKGQAQEEIKKFTKEIYALLNN